MFSPPTMRSAENPEGLATAAGALDMPQLRVRAPTSPWHVTTRSDEPGTRTGALVMWSLQAAPNAARASTARRTMADAGFRDIEDKLILEIGRASCRERV